MPSVPGPMTKIDYPIPDWFRNPADEGKPCCCKPAAQLSGFGRSDSTPLWSPYITMNVKFTLSGCFKDMTILWWTCWRPDGTGGVIPACVNSPTCRYFGGATSLMGPYITQVRLRYLSCENNKWVKHEERAGRTYFWGWRGWY